MHKARRGLHSLLEPFIITNSWINASHRHKCSPFHFKSQIQRSDDPSLRSLLCPQRPFTSRRQLGLSTCFPVKSRISVLYWFLFCVSGSLGSLFHSTVCPRSIGTCQHLGKYLSIQSPRVTISDYTVPFPGNCVVELVFLIIYRVLVKRQLLTVCRTETPKGFCLTMLPYAASDTGMLLSLCPSANPMPSLRLLALLSNVPSRAQDTP